MCIRALISPFSARTRILLVLFSFVSGASAAAPCPSAQEYVERIVGWDPLPRLQGAYDYEKLAAGRILEAGEKFPADIPDGLYPFSFDDEGRMLWEARRIDLDAARPLVTHRSLDNRYLKTYRRRPRIVFAGEFRIKNGRVRMVSNKSGTYKRNGKRLKVAVERLRERGLAIEDDLTEIRDMAKSPVDGAHMAELADARSEIVLRTTPGGEALLQKLRAATLEWSRQYPGRYAGDIDWQAFGKAKHLKVARFRSDFDRFGDAELTRFGEVAMFISASKNPDYYGLLVNWLRGVAKRLDYEAGIPNRVLKSEELGLTSWEQLHIEANNPYPITPEAIVEARRQIDGLSLYEGLSHVPGRPEGK